MLKIEDVQLKKYGNSFFLHIPIDYVKHKSLTVNKKYTVLIEKSKGGKRGR